MLLVVAIDGIFVTFVFSVPVQVGLCRMTVI